MNHNTLGWGQSRGTLGRRTSPSRRSGRGLTNRLPRVLLASLGLAMLGVTAMWSEAATAREARGLTRQPTRTPSTPLVSTVISVAPDPRGSMGSGRQSKLSASVMPVRILPIEPVAVREAIQDEAGSQTPAKPRPTAKPKPAAKPRGRLPRFFGKVGVSAVQKRRIYSIQATYRQRVEALNRQLEELRTRERKELLETLTSLQKQRLAELIRMADLARKARLRARQQRKSSPKSPKKPVPGGPGIR